MSPMADHPVIENVPLYTNVDRIARGLAAVGIGPGDPIPPETLFPMDEWHYHGTQAIQAAADALGLGPGNAVLDVGSGVGGPARYLAHRIGCRVTALELQASLHDTGADLTRRCGLERLVSHVRGDALTYPLAESAFDAVVSWLAILHIPDRPQLLARLARALRPGGGCYFEDLCMRAPFSATDERDLRRDVYGISVTSLPDYAADLRTAGFVDVAATDMTHDWAPYAARRLADWRTGRKAYIEVHGEGAYLAQERFYDVIARLYDSGSLGGIRLTGRTPATP